MSYPYFDLETASELLPWVRERVKELKKLRREVEESLVMGEKQLLSIYVSEVDSIVSEIAKKGIIIRDVEKGIVDFPAVINDAPAYLCWRYGEPEIMYWHYVGEGFSNRKRIKGNENILSLR
ncbi:hypothetical protein HS7_00770 [Sulfolobales archaeon HS-7]|nr:hypothetical protein HS7_00770 [Sulfolobales archaeon HS-7]